MRSAYAGLAVRRGRPRAGPQVQALAPRPRPSAATGSTSSSTMPAVVAALPVRRGHARVARGDAAAELRQRERRLSRAHPRHGGARLRAHRQRGSVAAHTGNPTNHHYAAAKAALTSLGRSLTKEYAAAGVTINTVAPGLIDNAFHVVHTPCPVFEELVRSIPARPRGQQRGRRGRRRVPRLGRRRLRQRRRPARQRRHVRQLTGRGSGCRSSRSERDVTMAAPRAVSSVVGARGSAVDSSTCQRGPKRRGGSANSDVLVVGVDQQHERVVDDRLAVRARRCRSPRR